MKQYSYSVVWRGTVLEPMTRALYLTRQLYRKTISWVEYV